MPRARPRCAGEQGCTGSSAQGGRAPNATQRPHPAVRMKWEPADKPGSVVSSHSSGPRVAARFKRPTRERRGQRHGSPIRSCSRWGLPCHAALAPRAVRSYRTVSPSPRVPPPLYCRPLKGRDLAVGRCAPDVKSAAVFQQYRGDGTVRLSVLCCTFRRLAPPRRYLAPCPMEPGLSSARERDAAA